MSHFQMPIYAHIHTYTQIVQDKRNAHLTKHICQMSRYFIYFPDTSAHQGPFLLTPISFNHGMEK